jgi:hypothetical protein
LAGDPAGREAGGEDTGGLRPAGGHREAASRHGETTSWVRETGRRLRESSCRARVPAKVRKSSSEVEEEGQSRDDER